MVRKIEKLVVKGKSGRDIVADFTYKEGGSDLPLIIFCHGFKGFKDWGHFNLMAEEFASKGFAFLKFNFSHNGGTIDNPIDFPDLQAFGENDLMKEIEDMSVMMGMFFQESDILEGANDFDSVLPLIDTSKISLIGHSRGGGMATIFCAQEPRIKNLVLLASVSDFEARQPDPAVLQKWKKDGVIYIENGRTKQQMPMYYNFVEVFENNREVLNIASACQKLTQQTLVIHGIDDHVVKVEEAYNLVSWLSTPSSLFIEGSDHVFGSYHPCQEKQLPGDTAQVISAIMSFLN